MALKIKFLITLIFFVPIMLFSQNSMIGDGFGGRLWYTPYNYTVGSYSGYTICGDACGNNNQLYGWGGNYYYQLGDGTNISSTPPVAAIGMTDVKFYTTGYCMAVIKNDNTGWAWGKPFQLAPISTAPIQVTTDVKHADAGTNVCAFVKNDGTVWSVGSNGVGSFGNGTITAATTSTPSQMIGINNAVRVAVTQLTTAVLLKDGTVKVAGKNARGGLGNNSALTAEALTPVSVIGLKDIVDIKGNEGTHIALDKNGNVYGWGSNGWNAVGDGGPGGSTDNRIVPVKIPGLTNVVAISGCDDGIHFMALDANHNCYSWGFSAYGQLGSGTIIRAATPVLVATNVADILAGESFSYIIKTDGTLWATGGSPSIYYTTMPASIYMNLSDIERTVFTQIDPTIPPMNLCPPVKIFSAYASPISCGTIAVTVGGGTAPYTYDIGQGPQSSNIFSGLTPGSYSVIVKDNNGCTKTADVNVTLGNGITGITISTGNPTCDLQNGTIAIGTVLGGTSPYQYSVDGSGFTFNTNYSNLAAGSHTITVKDAFGCEYSEITSLQNISVQPTTANAGTDQTISSTSTTINANQPVDGIGKWTIVSGPGSITDPTQFNTSIKNLLIGKTILRWTITNNCGTSTDEMEINVKFKDGQIFVPSAFTPNNDGTNDYFNFIANADIKIIYFRVYNRWGQLIYSNSPNSFGWNGFYNGAEQPIGIYAWTLQAINELGKPVNLKGTVSLIR